VTGLRAIPRRPYRPPVTRAPDGGGVRYRALETDLPRVFDFTRGVLKRDYVDPSGRFQSAAEDRRKQRETDGRVPAEVA